MLLKVLALGQRTKNAKGGVSTLLKFVFRPDVTLPYLAAPTLGRHLSVLQPATLHILDSTVAKTMRKLKKACTKAIITTYRLMKNMKGKMSAKVKQDSDRDIHGSQLSIDAPRASDLSHPITSDQVPQRPTSSTTLVQLVCVDRTETTMTKR